MPASVYTEAGQSISLTARLGGGGEGDIYVSPLDPLECAKVYTKTIPPETLKKLSLMIGNPPSDPTWTTRRHRSICWPSSLLYKNLSKNDLAGFLMPRLDLKTFQTAFIYLLPDLRTARFGGGFTWKHLVTAAANMASSVAAIHQQGYCIGDLNESNILIAPNALISIIDCDSFQVPDPKSARIYRAPVGKGEYSAPELIGKILADVDRTVATDSFSLAILFFQLMMQGTHPYQAVGRLVENASTPEAKILLGHFPYTMNNRDAAPPAHAPSYENLHPEVRKLFERCFTAGNKDPHVRPTAGEWYATLRNISASFKRCPDNSNHSYFDHLRSCPWCAMKEKSGQDPFPPPLGDQVALDDTAILLDSLDKRLEYLQPYVIMAYADGILTPEEETQLTAYGQKLQIPAKEIEKLIRAEAEKVHGKRGAAPGSPQLTLSRTSFAFDNVRHGVPLYGQYTITNTGGGMLSGRIKSIPSWIQPLQSSIDTSHHIQEHSFTPDTSKLTPGSSNRGAILLESNAGTARIDISVSVELETILLKRWRKRFFWTGAALGTVFGLGLYLLAPQRPALGISDAAGFIGAIALIAVCGVAGKVAGGIGGVFLATALGETFHHLSMRGYSMLAWAEIASAFLFFWAKPLLVAKLAGNRRMSIWAAASGLVLASIIISAGLMTAHNLPKSVDLGSLVLPVEDKLAGSTLGVANGIQWTNALGNRGALFTSASSSRIEYPGLIPSDGTLEFWINVNDGYWYDNSRFLTGRDDAMIFSSDTQGGDVTWPGTTKIFVSRNGNLSLWMANNKYDKPPAVATQAHRTRFRFGQWHALGFSYGSNGQYIMLDGRIVASNPGRTQTFGAAGNHQKVLDVPTIGETVSHFWVHHRYEGGFDGILAAFRISNRQQDWSLALTPPSVNDNIPPATTGKSENSTQTQTPVQQTPKGRQHAISDHLDRARALFKAEQYSGAIDECNAVLKLDPGNAAAETLKTQIEQTRKLLE